MAEGVKATEHTGEWLDAEQPLPIKAKKGGLFRHIVGHLDPDTTSIGGLIDFQSASGVHTEAVMKDGKAVVEVSVNEVILPKKTK